MRSNFEIEQPDIDLPYGSTIDDWRASVPVIKTTEMDATAKTTSSAEPNDIYPDKFATPQDMHPDKFAAPNDKYPEDKGI